MSGNFEHCRRVRAMTAAEAALAMARLAELATQGQPLALGLWQGTLTGTESGQVHQGAHVAVFTDDTLFAPFGPQGDPAGEAGAALLVLAARHAADFARYFPAGYAPGALATLCVPIIEGQAADRPATGGDMPPHLVALASRAEDIQAMDRELLRAQAALRSVIDAFGSTESRSAERNPIQSAALRAAYEALGMAWPAEA